MSSQFTAKERLSNISSQMDTQRFKDVPLAPPDAILGATRSTYIYNDTHIDC